MLSDPGRRASARRIAPISCGWSARTTTRSSAVTATDLAQTPTLDKLAHEGVLYERCFAWPVCAPSRFALISGMYAVSCGPAEHMRAQGKIPAWLKGFPAYLREAGYFTTNNAKTDYNSPIRIKEAWDLCGSGPIGGDAARASRSSASSITRSRTRAACFRRRSCRSIFRPPTGRRSAFPPYQPDTPEMRADWGRYYDHMKLLDEQIAAKLKALADDGLAENTIVFYYSDNGGVLPRSKRFLEESGTHVPLIIYFPPKWRHLAPAPPGTRIS